MITPYRTRKIRCQPLNSAEHRLFTRCENTTGMNFAKIGFSPWSRIMAGLYKSRFPGHVF